MPPNLLAGQAAVEYMRPRSRALQVFPIASNLCKNMRVNSGGIMLETPFGHKLAKKNGFAEAGKKRAREDQKVSCDAFVLIWWLRESHATVSYLLVRISLSMLTMRSHVR